MNKYLFKKMGIRSRVLTLAIFPVLLIAVSMAYYTAIERFSDSERYLRLRGQALVKHLASAGEFGLYSGNNKMLQSLLDSSARDADVEKLVVFDAANKVVAQAAGAAVSNGTSDSPFHYSQIVFESGIDVTDYESDLFAVAPKTGQPLGKVLVVMSPVHVHQEQRQILVNSVMLVLFGLGVSVFLALWVGNSVIRPIMNLSAGEKRLRSGDFCVRVEESSGGELGALESGFNALAVALQEATQDLQQQVAKATEALTHTVAQLEQRNVELDSARNDALSASKAKADFLAKMSHEIRTPMNAVLGFTRLLHRTQQTPDQWEYTRTIQRAALQLLTVIDDVLSFSRLESGAIELESVPFELTGVLEDVVSMLSATAHDKKLELVLLVHSDVPRYILGDPARISQILTNLVNNAIKFTEQGSVVVQAELESESTDGQKGNFKIAVLDTGIGIDSANLEQLFKEFSQADSSISRKFGGTGLGLTIARRFVEMMNGTMGVDSVLGEGSRFWFTLPFEAVQPEREDSYAEAQPLQGKNVIIYDDHSFSRRTLRNNLIFLGAGVFVARDQSHLQKILAMQGSTCDLTMIGLSNEELHQEELYQNHDVAATNSLIAQVRAGFSGPVVVLANRSGDELLSCAGYGGETLCLSKPVRRDRMRRVISKLLGTRSDPQVSFQDDGGTLSLDGLKVLVVEDNPFNRDLILTLLRGQSIEPVLVDNGLKAVDAAEARLFDVIFMDIHLPGIDGVEAVKRIKAGKGINEQTPVVALTADVFADSEQKLAQMGFEDVLLKPIIEEQLWNVLLGIKKGLNPNGVDQSEQEAQSSPATQSAAVAQGMENKLTAELQRLGQLLRAACDKRDPLQLKDYVHQLKGVAGYFGLQSMTVLATQMEGAQGDWDQFLGLLEEFERHLD
ncbi:MAG: ATP-binding protein [Gammaproteobacteria bacterium]|nr:ATP-binding protein [Gammaproteobacteria bacterium]MDH5801982.1 ATP-binding protein [Gammaproteobacteria bacterium]